MMHPASLRVYDFETVKLVDGYKVLEPKKKEGSWGIPHMSNTPSTSYIKVERDGKTAILRKYGHDRNPVMDYEYGWHKGHLTWHTHTWEGDDKGKATAMTSKERKKYGKMFRRAGLKL